MDERRGDWIATASWGRFWPLDPRPDEVKIEDIVHVLSCVGHFGGHARWFYSVAQHGVLAARYCDDADALWGLLHDASEAYPGDVPRPLKRQSVMDGYRDAESALMAAMCERFGLGMAEPIECEAGGPGGLEGRRARADVRRYPYPDGSQWWHGTARGPGD